MADEFFARCHQIQVITACLVPLQHGQLRQVFAAPLVLPEALADLKYPGISGGQQLFHAQLGRGLQESVTAGDCLNMSLGRRRRNFNRGFDFKVIPLNKKTANFLNDPGTQKQVTAYIRLSICCHKILGAISREK
jgi:hypothetical protein